MNAIWSSFNNKMVEFKKSNQIHLCLFQYKLFLLPVLGIKTKNYLDKRKEMIYLKVCVAKHKNRVLTITWIKINKYLYK